MQLIHNIGKVERMPTSCVVNAYSADVSLFKSSDRSDMETG